MEFFHRVGISTAALALSSGTALATPAITLTDLNMRAGPGTFAPVVITVPGGSPIDVQGCDDRGWCAVRYGRFAGYMSQTYLGPYGAPPSPPVVYAPPPPPVAYHPYYYWQPHWGYGYGRRGYGWRRW